jgi:hypothetical protein
MVSEPGPWRLSTNATALPPPGMLPLVVVLRFGLRGPLTACPVNQRCARVLMSRVNLKFTGLTQNLGQL